MNQPNGLICPYSDIKRANSFHKPVGELNNGKICETSASKKRQKVQVLTLPFYISKYSTILNFHSSIKILYTLLICFVFGMVCNQIFFECFIFLNIRLL